MTYFMLPVPTSHSTTASVTDKGDKDSKRTVPPNNKGGTTKEVSKRIIEGKQQREEERSHSAGFERDAFTDASRRAYMFQLQSWDLQAGCIVPT